MRPTKPKSKEQLQLMFEKVSINFHSERLTPLYLRIALKMRILYSFLASYVYRRSQHLTQNLFPQRFIELSLR